MACSFKLYLSSTYIEGKKTFYLEET